MTPANHCDLTVHNGRTCLRLRGDGIDVIYPLDASEAAAIIARLGRTLTTYLTPAVDRTDTSLDHPDNDTLRDTKEPV